MKAEELFTAVPKLHNCAQSVAAGAGHDELVAELARCGGGNAPLGMCGALYAAQQLVPSNRRSALEKEFAGVAGGTTCRELKMIAHFPCLECVKLAASLAEKYQK